MTLIVMDGGPLPPDLQSPLRPNQSQPSSVPYARRPVSRETRPFVKPPPQHPSRLVPSLPRVAIMDRKESSPMAPPFMVSAPGKVIVCGEHAAIYGQPTIAASISLRSYLLVTTLSKSKRTIRLKFKDLGLDHTWDINSLPWDLSGRQKQSYVSTVTAIDQELLQAILPHANAVSPHLDEKQRQTHVRPAIAFLYLFLCLGDRHSPGAIYTLRSTIPIGAGLGSSASVCVCISAAILLQIRALAGPHPKQPVQEAELQIQRINDWAFVGELCIHGDPSGVDNTISAGGKAVIFRRHDNDRPTVTPLLGFPKVSVLLVDTRHPRSTATQIEKVKILKSQEPAVTQAILNAIGQVTSSAIEHIKSDDGQENGGDGVLGQLGTLMRVNHGLLVSLGVSHSRLEQIRELVDDPDIGWSKLTGAGGGGCALAMLRPGVDETTLETLIQTLDDRGFRTYKTTLGCDGVGVLWPATFRDGTGSTAGEEINEELFEGAVGPDGLDRLVGPTTQGSLIGWKFWKREVIPMV
ncbi:mevalonate kinase [Microdochium trichocladiopsis]|uniref:Mevalonate kinase n=1 Tax=Microdochium trichocladiopsis TaxID=1682393 RepID=A0A9P9BJH3_9PEZI|nr:mevalonate kinase [Microdochium trichocladiopsis]KAH7025238.1 mevalonate kinase [Microdochium trichocladiopsis]